MTLLRYFPYCEDLQLTGPTAVNDDSAMKRSPTLLANDTYCFAHETFLHWKFPRRACLESLKLAKRGEVRGKSPHVNTWQIDGHFIHTFIWLRPHVGLITTYLHVNTEYPKVSQPSKAVQLFTNRSASTAPMSLNMYAIFQLNTRTCHNMCSKKKTGGRLHGKTLKLSSSTAPRSQCTCLKP